MKIKCDNCRERVERNGEFYETLDGKLFCEGCREAEMEYPSTVICFKPDGASEAIQFTKSFGSIEDPDDGMPLPIKSQKWVKTDAWRGYSDWELVERYVEVADGWITGFPDRTVERKIELADIFDKLRNGEIKPPCELYWIFGITSNIFSTASTVAVAKENMGLIEKWLNKIDGGIEGLKEMLS